MYMGKSYLKSVEKPTNREKLLDPSLLHEFPFDVGNKFLPLKVHLVLRNEKRTALLVALGFEGLDRLLAGELFLQRQRRCSGAA